MSSLPSDGFPDTEALSSRPAPSGGSGPAPARHLGDYEILDEIARGGMGIVYRARQKSLDRVVALKMIRDAQLADAADVERFKAEAQAAGRLEHPNIVPVYEVGEWHDADGRALHFFTMKLIEGGNLAQHVARLSKDARAGVAIATTVARAVHHAHQRGILHRDLKPANILIADSQQQSAIPMITDFGLARRLDARSAPTLSGAVVGTPEYMAPEQARAVKGVTVAADIYSLGVILFELLTGRVPFRGDNLLETLRQTVECEPPSLRSLRSTVDRDLEAVCLKCLEKEPARRYGSAEALADDLDRWLDGRPVLARSAGAWERLKRWTRRRPAVAALLLVSAVSLLALLVLLGFLWRNAELRAEAVQSLTQAQLQAEQLTQRAEEKRAEVSRLEAHALEVEAQARRVQYAADLQFAHAAWKNDDVAGMLALLDEYRPRPGRDDLRGFEWYHLQHLSRGDRFTLELFPPTKQMMGFLAAVSHDGRFLVCQHQDTLRLFDLGQRRLLRTIPLKTKIVGLSFRGDNKALLLTPAPLSRPDMSSFPAINQGKEPPSLAFFRPLPLRELSLDERADLGPEIVQDWKDLGPPLNFLGNLEAAGVMPIIPLPDHQMLATVTVCLSPDRRSLAVGGISTRTERGKLQVQKGAFTLWDVKEKRLRHLALTGGTFVIGTAFSPDGNTLAVAGLDHTLRLFNPAKPEVERDRLALPGPAVSLRFSPDGSVLAAGLTDGLIQLIDPHHGTVRGVCKGHIRAVQQLAWSGDGKTLYSCSNDGTLKVWDVARSSTTALPTSAQVAALAFSPRHDVLLSVEDNGELRWHDLATRSTRVVELAGIKGPFGSAALSPDLKLVALTQSQGDVIHLQETEGGKPWRTLKTGQFSRIMGFLPSGKELMVQRWDREPTAELWNVETGERSRVLHRGKRPFDLALSPDGRRFAVSNLRGVTGERLEVRDTATGALLFQGPEDARRCAFSPDGREVATAGLGWVRCLDAETGRLRRSFTSAGRQLESLVYDPSGQRLAAAGVNEETERTLGVRLWDLTSGREVFEFNGPPLPVHALAFSNDGQRLAAAYGAVATFVVGPGGHALHLWEAPRAPQRLVDE